MFLDPPDFDEIWREGEEYRREQVAEVRAGCSHEWVAGAVHVPEEDLRSVVALRQAAGETVECQRCELVATPEVLTRLGL